MLSVDKSPLSLNVIMNWNMNTVKGTVPMQEKKKKVKIEMANTKRLHKKWPIQSS